jgi:hypothetical protein
MYVRGIIMELKKNYKKTQLAWCICYGMVVLLFSKK